MTFYENLKVLMNEQQVTAKQLSEELNINKNSFTYWKQKGNIPKGEALKSIADYFNVSIDYLLGKSNIKKEQTVQEEQPASEELKKLIEISSTLSDDEARKVREYVEFLKSQRK